MSIGEQLRIKQLKAELETLRNQHTIDWVGQRLGEALAIQLALKPYANWSSNEKQTLHAVCQDATTAYQIYVSLLPKE